MVAHAMITDHRPRIRTWSGSERRAGLWPDQAAFHSICYQPRVITLALHAKPGLSRGSLCIPGDPYMLHI